MERLRSERGTSVDIGPSNAQPPTSTAAATTSTAHGHTQSGWVGWRLTRRDGSAWARRAQAPTTGPSLDHVVRSQEHRRGQREAESPGGLEVDGEVVPARPL